jgi:CYTH domain-containing protein
MTLTVEFTTVPNSTGEVTVFCDEKGLEVLIEQLSILKKHRGHVHLMTPAWAGRELTEDKQIQSNALINHLRIVLKEG